jgi:hypothetical protein
VKIAHASIGVAVLALAGCNTYGNDQGARYLQRVDTVTMSAGDAKEVNARSQMLAAWPRGVGDRNIPMQGTRAARAAECYRQGSGQQLVSDQKGRTPNQTQNNTASGPGASAGGGAGAATQLNCGH